VLSPKLLCLNPPLLAQTPMDPQDVLDDIARVAGIDYATLSAIISGYAVESQRQVMCYTAHYLALCDAHHPTSDMPAPLTFCYPSRPCPLTTDHRPPRTRMAHRCYGTGMHHSDKRNSCPPACRWRRWGITETGSRSRLLPIKITEVPLPAASTFGD
jgi:hypothetical protein